MVLTINKDDKAPLCEQLKNILINEIKRGRLKPGKRIPGERAMAAKYGVSRGTAVEALKLLEKDGYIERLAVKGTFVTENINERLSTLNILFPFPEVSISRNIIDYHNWVIDTEMYSGLLDGACKYNININFQYWEPSDDPAILMKQLKKMREFDGTFINTLQYETLMKAAISENVPYLLFEPNFIAGHPMTISYDLKKSLKDCAEYLASCGYSSVGLFLHDRRSRESELNMSYFRQCLEEEGVEPNEKWTLRLPDDEEMAFEMLMQRLPDSTDKLPEVFFGEQMTSPLAFLRVAHEKSWQVGEDIDLMGYAGESAMRNTIPQMTYLRLPYVEIGREACRLLHEKISQKHNKIIHYEIPTRIVEGKSTRKR